MYSENTHNFVKFKSLIKENLTARAKALGESADFRENVYFDNIREFSDHWDQEIEDFDAEELEAMLSVIDFWADGEFQGNMQFDPLDWEDDEYDDISDGQIHDRASIADYQVDESLNEAATPEKVIQFLIKKGHSKQQATDAVNKHFTNAMKAYSDATPATVAKYILAGNHAEASNYRKTNEDVEQLDELSKQTMSSYAKKAAPNIASQSAHAMKMHNAFKTEPSEHMKSQYKKARDDADRKANNRVHGVLRAQDKLQKEDDQLDESMENHIIMQLKSALDVQGNKAIKFRKGEEKVDIGMIQKILAFHDKLQKPDDKRKLRVAISKSAKDFSEFANML